MMATTPLWQPNAERVRVARITDYMAWLARTRGLAFSDYDALWRWSVSDPGAFWDSLWDYFAVIGDRRSGSALVHASMPGAVWFPDAMLNYAEQVFRHATDERPAIVAGREGGEIVEVSWAELARKAGALASTLRTHGVTRGDRVV